MTCFSLHFDWLYYHRRSVQGLERLWKPTPAIRSRQQSVRRRRWTLLTITICLHVLLWSSLIPFITMLALFAAQKIDTTVLPSTVLTIISVCPHRLFLPVLADRVHRLLLPSPTSSYTRSSHASRIRWTMESRLAGSKMRAILPSGSLLRFAFCGY